MGGRGVGERRRDGWPSMLIYLGGGRGGENSKQHNDEIIKIIQTRYSLNDFKIDDGMGQKGEGVQLRKMRVLRETHK